VSLRDSLVLVPLIAAIVAFALYPQQAISDAERSVRAVNAPVLEAAGVRGAARAEVAP
jgi:hypothetical protein